MLSAMSSSQHYNEAPEFPSLPRLSLDAALEFARKSQAAIDYVQRANVTLQGKSFVFLPLISPHHLQYRFNVSKSSVFVMVRKTYQHLKEQVDSINLEQYAGIYVRGPVGVGKSYLLYLLAAEYRMNRNSYRVTYINDCAMWRRLPYHFILKELVTTFYDDAIGGKSILELCQAVIESNKEEKLMITTIDSLIDYVHAANLKWIIICDQHNAFYNPSVVKNFPFNLINTIAEIHDLNVKVVISASANNEGYPTEMKGWKTHEISSHRFDMDEFRVWCEHYQLEDGIVNHESEEALDALYWTGGIPYELDLLWKQPRPNLIEKTKLYKKEREKDIVSNHRKFTLTLEENDKLNLREFISRMALGLSPPNIDVGMDRQVMVIDHNIDGETVITALNPVARAALITYHGQGLLNSLKLVSEIVLKETDYTNDTKGRIIEKYITTMLELSKHFSFQPKKTTKTGLSNANLAHKSVKIDEIIHFSGNQAPLPNSFKKGKNTLFVPKSPNYPGLDFFIWNSDAKVLMAFQVTVKNPFTTHSKIEGAIQNCQTWLDFCSDGLGKKKIDIYWIIPKTCVGKPKNFVDHVLLLEDLSDDFPGLNGLTLQ